MATQEKAGTGSVPFIVAFVSLVAAIIVAILLSGRIKAMQLEINALEFRIHRATAVLTELGLTLEPSGSAGDPQASVVPGSGRSEIQAALDQSKVAAALGQLRNVQRSFLMHISESMKPEFPPTDTIRTFADLHRIILYYLPGDPAEETLSWTFLCYYRKSSQDFLLVAEAKDSQRTLITVTSSQITPWYSRSQ